MHEASLAGSILMLVEDAALRERFGRVSQLRLEVGRLAAVEVEALRFALQAIAPGTVLEGAELAIVETPGQAECLDCGANCEVVEHGQACPQCGSYRLQVRGGDSLRVIDMLVGDSVSLSTVP